jgi:hypothetical protein
MVGNGTFRVKAHRPILGAIEVFEENNDGCIWIYLFDES